MEPRHGVLWGTGHELVCQGGGEEA